MLTPECLHELQSAWLPNLTDSGLDRIIELLEKASPLLTSGCFTRAIPMGCLATHAGWHHPRTTHLTQDAGITWLHRVARLNPGTSHVLRAWDDRRGVRDPELVADLIGAFRQERAARRRTKPAERKPAVASAR
jgi:hypothetical protein